MGDDPRDLELFKAQLDPKFDPWINPPHSLRLVIPFLPPSSNKIYFTDWRRKMRVKSDPARAFESKFSAEVVPKYLPWISQMDDVVSDDRLILAVRLDYYFPRDEVLNKGYLETYSKGAKKGQRKAKTRYKKMDTGNRFKLIVDCLATALAVDDLHFWDTGGRKLIAESFDMEPQVHIFVVKQDPATFGAFEPILGA